MPALLEKLGIDYRLLAAQIVNFSILLFILYKFLYKPILKILEERSKKIEKSLKDAEKIEKNLKEIEEEKEKKIVQAKKEAQEILEKALKEGEKMKEEVLESAKKEEKRIIQETKKALEEERGKVMEEIKSDVSDMVIELSSQVIQKNLDSEDNRKLIKKTIEEI